MDGASASARDLGRVGRCGPVPRFPAIGVDGAVTLPEAKVCTQCSRSSVSSRSGTLRPHALLEAVGRRQDVARRDERREGHRDRHQRDERHRAGAGRSPRAQHPTPPAGSDRRAPAGPPSAGARERVGPPGRGRGGAARPSRTPARRPRHPRPHMWPPPSRSPHHRALPTRCSRGRRARQLTRTMPRTRIGPGSVRQTRSPSHNDSGPPRTTRTAIRKIEAVGKASSGRSRTPSGVIRNASQTPISVAAPQQVGRDQSQGVDVEVAQRGPDRRPDRGPAARRRPPQPLTPLAAIPSTK